MASYSYKPASGLEGASTVVPLRAGGFLEVRRGTKTTWRGSDERRTWPTLEAWKATLPADATVVEKHGRRKAYDNMAVQTAGPTLAPSAWSADFKAVVDVVKGVTGANPRNTTVFVHDNAYGAAKYTVEAEREETRLAFLRTERDHYYTRSNIDQTTKLIASYRDLASKELAKPAYSDRLFHRFTKPRVGDVMVQRLSDGEFVPLFFDMRRGMFFLPASQFGRTVNVKEGGEGSSFAEIGVRPVFLVRTKAGTLQMVRIVTDYTLARATGTVTAASTATGGGSAVSLSE